MPYIKMETRKKFDWIIDNLIAALAEDSENISGNLNYCITVVLKRLIEKNKRYKTMNDLIGSLECIKLKLYRRVVAPYENEKIAENGDVL